jgi:DNA-directed RNA polymerase specialized sigma24 family protein
VLAGAAGYGLMATRWYAAPIRAVEAGLAIEAPGHAGEVLASELDGMCVAADEIEPSLAQSSAAPACEFLTSETRSLDDCLALLRRDAVPDLRQQLRRRGLDPYDIDDAIMKGQLAACTRQPSPRRLRAYFAAVADNQATQRAADPRRTALCETSRPLAETCTTSEPAASRAVKLARLWDDAMCRIGDDAADLLRRRVQHDESFREIADHLGVRESDARDAYHRAILQLGTIPLARCDDPAL